MRVRVRTAVAYAVAAIVALVVGYVVVVGPLRSSTGSGEPTGSGVPTEPSTPSTSAAQPTQDPGSSPAPTTATVSGAPMPVGDLPGWRQVLADDFAGSELDERKWFRYDGQPEGDPGGWFDPSHVSVADGRLIIGAWAEPARRNLYATGGISHHAAFSQTYGRYEIRFRAERGTGIAYALLLWPKDDLYPPEIDIAEDNGRDRQIIHGFLHPTDTSYPKESFQIPADATQWHTVGLEWTPGKAVFTLDGEPWGTVEGPQVPAEPMDLALQTQAWYCGHGWEACPDETTPERVDLEIDWAVIYALDQ
jgi:beta-glucanase (GH16 family)